MFRALILVDIQNDFCAGGALAVPHGDEVVAVANELKKEFRHDLIIATQDWHPANHGSFAVNNGRKPFETGILCGLVQKYWPVHCVQNEWGSQFHKDLDLHGVTVFRKGTDVNVDSYSGFYDNGRKKSTGLTDYLTNLDVNEVWVMGLATDYCVKTTALDAQQDGFRTLYYHRGCRGIDPNVGAVLNEMKTAGISIL